MIKDYAYYYGCFVGLLNMSDGFTKEELVKYMKEVVAEKEADDKKGH